MHAAEQRERMLNLVFVVNGEDVSVEVRRDAPLDEARGQALTRSQNTGRPAADWEIRDQHGQQLDPRLPVGTYSSIREGGRLFLTLKTGAGGA